MVPSVRVPVLILALFWAFSTPARSLECTTFLLRSNGGLSFVHSLNQGDWDSVPDQLSEDEGRRRAARTPCSSPLRRIRRA